MDRQPESPDVIEQDMQHTRESLTQKVAALEGQVLGTLQTATSTAQETVQSVQETVQTVKHVVEETVSGVKETVTESVHSLSAGVRDLFDVTGHTRRNPLGMVAGAAAAGFLTGYLTARGSAPSPAAGHSPSHGGGDSSAGGGFTGRVSSAVSSAAGHLPGRPGWFDDLLGMAGRELYKVGEQAVTRFTGQLQQAIDAELPKLVDSLSQRVPGLADQLGDLLGAPPARPKSDGASAPTAGRPVYAGQAQRPGPTAGDPIFEEGMGRGGAGTTPPTM